MQALRQENTPAARGRVPAAHRTAYDPRLARGFRLCLIPGPAHIDLPGLQRLLVGHNRVLLLGPGQAPVIRALLPMPGALRELRIAPCLLALAEQELGLLAPGESRFRVPLAQLSAEAFLRWRLLGWSARPGHHGESAALALCRSVLLAVACDARRRPLPAAGPTVSGRSRFELAQQAAELIERHWQTGMSLESLAERFSLSPFHLLRSFRRTLGLTPHQYLLQLRLRRSFDLLESGALRIIDVALACGFSSHGHFSTTFRRAFGLSPLAYQRLGDAQGG